MIFKPLLGQRIQERNTDIVGQSMAQNPAHTRSNIVKQSLLGGADEDKILLRGFVHMHKGDFPRCLVSRQPLTARQQVQHIQGGQVEYDERIVRKYTEDGVHRGRHDGRDLVLVTRKPRAQVLEAVSTCVDGSAFSSETDNTLNIRAHA
jgi:hypothetical protein